MRFDSMSSSSIRSLCQIALFAAIIAVCSQIQIPLTVPFTMQTFAVFSALAILGGKNGTISILIYIALGAIGVPVFSGFKSGFGVLLGSTGGYIIGFIFTALIVGIVSDKTNKLWALILSMVVGILVCYAFGTAWFAVVYAKTNEPASLATILGWCVIPFLIPDAIKIALAAVLTNRLKKFVK